MDFAAAPRAPLRELPFNGVYRVKDGAITLLDSDKDRPGGFPNGIAFSPDEKYLYVTAGFGKTLRWDVQPDGSIANPRTFIPAGNDGMKTDSKGNLYSVNAVGPGEVWITSPEGKNTWAPFNCHRSWANRGRASARLTWHSAMQTIRVSTSRLARTCSRSG